MRARLPTLLLAALVLVTTPAAARRRPLFEPTDLELEDPGVAEVDLQYGAFKSDAPWRVVVPDLEVDVGLTENVEVDVDGAFAVSGPDDGSLSPEHEVFDNIWLCTKLELYDNRNDETKRAFAAGIQLGPKLPVAPEAHGIGYEGLVLAGFTWGESHLVFNVGGLVDPGAEISRKRPAGVEGGVDLDLDLGWSDLSMSAELGGVAYVSSDPNDLHATAGLTWAESKDLDISVAGLVGFLPGGDRVGFLIGVSPKLTLWK
jgi:hypothetical protein